MGISAINYDFAALNGAPRINDPKQPKPNRRERWAADRAASKAARKMREPLKEA
jgi:hypothetical protein